MTSFKEDLNIWPLSNGNSKFPTAINDQMSEDDEWLNDLIDRKFPNNSNGQNNYMINTDISDYMQNNNNTHSSPSFSMSDATTTTTTSNTNTNTNTYPNSLNNSLTNSPIHGSQVMMNDSSSMSNSIGDLMNFNLDSSISNAPANVASFVSNPTSTTNLQSLMDTNNSNDNKLFANAALKSYSSPNFGLLNLSALSQQDSANNKPQSNTTNTTNTTSPNNHKVTFDFGDNRQKACDSLSSSRSSSVSASVVTSSASASVVTGGAVTTAQEAEVTKPAKSTAAKPKKKRAPRKRLTPHQKQAHNKIEKRYRININTKIANLQQIIPWVMGEKTAFNIGGVVDGTGANIANGSPGTTSSDNEPVEPPKLNKSMILEKAIHYILHLQSETTVLSRQNQYLQSQMMTIGAADAKTPDEMDQVMQSVNGVLGEMSLEEQEKLKLVMQEREKKEQKEEEGSSDPVDEAAANAADTANNKKNNDNKQGNDSIQIKSEFVDSLIQGIL
ncbi:Tye7 protein [Saccharomycopsis crataegensis]|uniref:Tye7 protein n=1 Tax=Saccharomycopsis crataegensis TaxID=43959 RepID=A0AAV5QV73_9ASCO|nr:Tye7 protein [Saccharomycopsis crataegensis]